MSVLWVSGEQGRRLASPEDGQSIRRRRECLSCQKRFTTYETVECLPIVVIKRDGARQAFDRNKILNGMLRACEKAPGGAGKLEEATDAIEQIIQNSLDREVSTTQIGELVMERLKPLDEVAYALCLGLPSVQGHRQLRARAQQAARRKVNMGKGPDARRFPAGIYWVREALVKSAAMDGEDFPPILRSGIYSEVH